MMQNLYKLNIQIGKIDIYYYLYLEIRLLHKNKHNIIHLNLKIYFQYNYRNKFQLKCLE